MHKVVYVETLASQEMPEDDSKYLWFDSKGITGQRYMNKLEAEPLIGFVVDSWLKPVHYVEEVAV